jgi:hypothetical protein
MSLQTSTIKVTVSLDGMSFTMSAVVAKHSTSKKDKALNIRDLADQIADFVEMPRKKKA